MFILIIRSTIVYFVLFAIVRFMGKRQIAELQPFELVITLIIAELAILPMQETGMPLINGIVPLLTLVSLHFLISILLQKSIVLRKIISGKPVILINPEGIQYEKLKKLSLTLNDLEEALRGQNFFSLKNVEYAILETNGKVSVLPKSNKRPTTPYDLNINPERSSLEVALIFDGKFLKHNLEKMKVDKDFVYKQIEKTKFKNIKSLLIVTLDANGQMYLQPKNGQYITLDTNYKGGSLE